MDTYGKIRLDIHLDAWYHVLICSGGLPMGITMDDIIRLVNSRYRVIWRKNNYEIRDRDHRFTVAIGFCAWSDALAYLLVDVEVI
jgi:hypothetical protein